MSLKLVRNFVILAIAALAVAFVSLNWIFPAATAYYAAKHALPITRVIPQSLSEDTVSTAPGRMLSYVGYEFDVPWTDLDDCATQLLPNGATAPNRVVLHFRSGLRLIVTALPPREWATNVARETKWSPQQMESLFGTDTSNSDYRIVKTIYEFTPRSMDFWSAQDVV